MPDEWWWSQPHQNRHAVTVPGTDEVIHAGSKEQCWDKWTRRCEDLGLKFPNPIRTFGDCCCRALSPELRERNCRRIDEDAPEIIRRRTILNVHDIWRATETAWDWFRSEESVTQEQATRRAETCRTCPHNTKLTGWGCEACTGIAQKLAATVFRFIGRRSTPHDAELGACDLCRCSLSVMIHVPLDALLAHQEGVEQPPSHCWKVTERVNAT